jgi:3-oxoacyl-[acyl-carrier protein] reductase
VARHVGEVAERAGGIDGSFNAIGIDDVQGTPLIQMSLEDFARPIMITTRTQFLTAKAVASHMLERGRA